MSTSVLILLLQCAFNVYSWCECNVIVNDIEFNNTNVITEQQCCAHFPNESNWHPIGCANYDSWWEKTYDKIKKSYNKAKFTGKFQKQSGDRCGAHSVNNVLQMEVINDKTAATFFKKHNIKDDTGGKKDSNGIKTTCEWVKTGYIEDMLKDLNIVQFKITPNVWPDVFGVCTVYTVYKKIYNILIYFYNVRICE